MNTTALYMTNRYQALSSTQGMKVSKAALAQANTSVHESRQNMREQLKALKAESEGREYRSAFSMKNDAAAKSAQTYSESLRTQREKSKETSLGMKRLKYQFKDISSKILRSKTSTAARQVAGQAKREVLRLKREAASGKYDAEEVEAALSHAKAMERVAKKKVKNLIAEEMAKASGQMSDSQGFDEDNTKTESEHSDDVAGAGSQSQGEYEDIYDEELDAPYYTQMEDVSSEIDYFASMSSQNDAPMAEMLKEFEEAMTEIMEETGLEDLADSMMSTGNVSTPEELKELKIKHRNKEMKDIVKADADYMKAMSKFLQKATGLGASNGQAAGVVSGAGFAGYSNTGAITVSATIDVGGGASAIDLSL